MKKLLALTLMATMLLYLAACGNKYDQSFDDDFPTGISFGISEKEIASEKGDDYSISTRGDSRTIMKYSNGDIYRLDNDKLTSLFISMSKTSALSILEKYGEADKAKNGFYFWYGTVDDVKCIMAYNDNQSTPGIEFEEG